MKQILGFYKLSHGIGTVSLTMPILGLLLLPHRAPPRGDQSLLLGARHPVWIND
jgi:hypothetical protein